MGFNLWFRSGIQTVEALLETDRWIQVQALDSSVLRIPESFCPPP